MAYSNIFEWAVDTAGHAVRSTSDWLQSYRGYWDPYYAGYNPVRYDSPQYAFNQVMAGAIPLYGSLYKFGGEQAFMDQYASNRGWSGIVQHPGSTQFGGWQSLGHAAAVTVSRNITRLYR